MSKHADVGAPTRGHVPEGDVSSSTLPSELGLNARAPQGNPVTPNKDINTLGSQIIREIVIPELTTEVNENKNFAHLRQVYNSLILATWYKKKIKGSILSQVYCDKNKVAGVNIDDPQEKQRIYERYLQAFKKGVYNYIKEEQDSVTQEIIPRKYFSGGVNVTDLAMNVLQVTSKTGYSQLSHHGDLAIVTSQIDFAMLNDDEDFVDPEKFSTSLPFEKKEYPGITDFNPYRNNGTLIAVDSDGEHQARSLDDGASGSNYVRHFESGPYKGKVFRINRSLRLRNKLVRNVLAGFAIAKELGIGPKVDGFTFLMDGRFTVVDDFEPGTALSKISEEEFGNPLETNQQKWSPYQKALVEFMNILINADVFVYDFFKEDNMRFTERQDGNRGVILIDPEDAIKSQDMKGRRLIEYYETAVRTNWEGIAKDFLLNVYFFQRLAENRGNPINKGDEAQRTNKDNAQLIKRPEIKGGIDLTPANMNLQTKNNSGSIKFNLNPAMLQQLQNAPGFVPVIINVQPLKSLTEFLGLSQGPEDRLNQG